MARKPTHYHIEPDWRAWSKYWVVSYSISEGHGRWRHLEHRVDTREDAIKFVEARGGTYSVSEHAINPT